MTDAIRVALCDDHAVVRSGLRRIVAEEPGLEVVGQAGTAEEATGIARAERPDVFVMDLGLPGTSGIQATRRIAQASAETKVLVLTVHDDIAYPRKAFEAGARGYLVKDAADVELVLAIRQVAAGEQYVHPRLGAALLAPAATGRVVGPGGELSERELEVLRRVALGHTNAEIATELYVSVRTVETHRAHVQQKLARNAHGGLARADVETHRAHVQQKLGRKARADLVRYAREHGLLEGGEEPGP